MFAIILAAIIVVAPHTPTHTTLARGLRASHAREAHAQSWHYLPGQRKQRKMDHLTQVWERNGMRQYARKHGGN